MRILIDISHPAHANFFKHVSRRLKDEGNEVIISVLQRGSLPNIVKKEYPDFLIIKSGYYHSNRFSIIFQANIQRFFIQLKNILKYKIELGLSCGSFTLGAALSIFRRPNYQFDDDPERKLNVRLEKLTATKLYFPPIIEKDKKITVFNALKEWSYLSPDYFSPEISALDVYNLKPKAYVFIREVQTKSLNYSGQGNDTILSISAMIPKNVAVLLSLEDKSKKEMYPENWILVQEPVKEIHSLIYYSLAVISSGDSMAREGAMLGVPSIYCGFREMKANNILSELGMLYKVEPDKVSSFLQEIMSGGININSQDEFRTSLKRNWIDLNLLIFDMVNQLKNKK